MAAQSLLAKLGMRAAVLGSVASLTIAAPLAAGDVSMGAHTDASRIGWFFDRTPGAEKTGHVVMGTEILSVGVAAVTSTVKVNTPASTALTAGLNVGQGIAPAAPVNGDFWITATGAFARIAGVTQQLDDATGITGTLTAGRVPFASGAQTLTDDATMTYSVVSGLTVQKINFAGSTSGSASIKVAAVAGTPADIVLPTTNGTAGFVLSTDGAGITSWISNAAAGATLAATQVGFGDAGNLLSGSPTMTYSVTTGLAINPSVTINQAVATTGSPTGLMLIGAAHTTLTASVEADDVDFALNRTVQFATGALTTQRAVIIRAPTYAFVAASTITNAATVAITGAPAAGTNATITNAYAFWVQANRTQLDGGLTVTGATNTAVITQSVATTGSPTGFLFTGGAHTTLTASVEAIDVNFALNRVVQFATGAIATQRAFLIQAPTYAFVGASTISTASTLEITGPPIAGTNATLTATGLWALKIASGRILVPAGTAVLPSIAFTESANDTGLYSVADGSVGISSNGGLKYTFANALLTSTNVINGPVGTAAAPTYSFTGDTNCGMFQNGADIIGFAVNGVLSTSIRTTATQALGNFNVAPTLVASGAACAFRVVTPADTAQTLSTEASSAIFDFTASRQFATGALATQRAFRIAAPTYAFVAASTITDAATFAISGAPVAGTNATITNAMALWVQAGMARFDGTAAIAAGAVGTPSLFFFGDSNTGIYSSAADTFNVTAGGVNTLKVTATTVTVTGKLTVTGLIDPTGVEFSAVAANPGAVPAQTIWFNSSDANKFYVGATPGALGGAVTASGITMSTARLLGRTTAATGAIEEISVGTGLSLAAGSLTCTVTAGITGTLVSGRVPFANGASSITDSAEMVFSATTGFNVNMASSGTDNLTLGTTAGDSLTSGSTNVLLGVNAGTALTTNGSCTAVGYNALVGTTGGYNTAVGCSAGTGIVSGTYNTAIGCFTLNGALAGNSGNTAVGYNALNSNTAAENTAVGSFASNSNTSGTRNCSFGNNTMANGSTGDDCTAMGYHALLACTVSENTAVGSGAAEAVTNAVHVTAVGFNALGAGVAGVSDSTAIGHNALLLATGANNTAVGSAAGDAISTGIQNTAVGTNALSGISANGDCTAIGFNALVLNTAAETTAVGSGALDANTSGVHCVAVGYNALGGTSTSNNNTAVGWTAGLTVTGADNTLVGAAAGDGITTGVQNTAFGSNALGGAVAANNGNVAIGYNALLVNTVGSNTAVGTNALQANTTGNTNTALGNAALFTNVTGSACTAVGSSALAVSTGDNNTAVGSNAADVLSSSSRITAVGANALGAGVAGVSDSTAIGFNALVVCTVAENTAVGSGASDALTTSLRCVAVGFNALGAGVAGVGDSTAIGHSALAAATGAFNTAVGSAAATALSSSQSVVAIGTRALTTGTSGISFSVAVGYEALTQATADENTAVGANAGDGITTGVLNTFLGRGADGSAGTVSRATLVGAATSSGFDDVVALGYLATTTAANQFVVGSANTSISAAYIGNGVTNSSPTALTMNATGGSGTNIAGASLTIAGGRSTGTGTGGSVIIATAPAGGSGSTLNALVNRLTVAQDGSVNNTYVDNSNKLFHVENTNSGTTARAGYEITGALGYTALWYIASDAYSGNIPASAMGVENAGTRAMFSNVGMSTAANRYLDADHTAGTVVSGSVYDWTFGGKVTTKATATGKAGFNLPHGTAPSAPVDGDLWTTSAGLFVRINGVTVGPLT